MDKNNELARERTAVIRATDFEDAVRIVGNIMNEKPAIDPEWILKYFEDDLSAIDVWVAEDGTIEDIYLDGSFSPRDMANLLTRKLADKIRELGEAKILEAEK